MDQESQGGLGGHTVQVFGFVGGKPGSIIPAALDPEVEPQIAQIAQIL